MQYVQKLARIKPDFEKPSSKHDIMKSEISDTKKSD